MRSWPWRFVEVMEGPQGLVLVFVRLPQFGDILNFHFWRQNGPKTGQNRLYLGAHLALAAHVGWQAESPRPQKLVGF